MKRARRAAANVFPEKITAERIGPSEAGLALFAEARGLLSQRCSSVGGGRLIPCCNIAGLACASALAKPVVESGYVIEPGPAPRQRGALATKGRRRGAWPARGS